MPLQYPSRQYPPTLIPPHPNTPPDNIPSVLLGEPIIGWWPQGHPPRVVTIIHLSSAPSPMVGNSCICHPDTCLPGHLSDWTKRLGHASPRHMSPGQTGVHPKPKQAAVLQPKMHGQCPSLYQIIMVHWTVSRCCLSNLTHIRIHLPGLWLREMSGGILAGWP